MFEFNYQPFIDKLELLQSNIPNALQAAGLTFVTLSQQTIINQGNGAWAPFKRLPKRPHQLLWETGTMLRGITTGNIDGDTITVGDNVAYAAAQNYGVPSHSLPARPFFVWDQTVADKVGAAYMKALMAGVN